MLTRPIFILGSHKSGSSLLRSLLDGHPELSVIPAETHFFQRAGFWVDYALRPASPRPLTTEQLIQALIRGVTRKNEGGGRTFGDSDLTGKIDVDRFVETLTSGHFTDDRTAFETYVGSLHLAMTGEPLNAAKRVVEKSVENAELAPVLRQMFPDCQFLHIVRNPYASLVAIRKSKTRGGFPNIAPAALALQNSYYNLYRNERSLDSYLVLTYEELVADVRSTMRRCAEFLGIGFDDVLTRPTLFGEAWGGNSSSGASFVGVSASPAQSWKTQITDLEIRLINATVGSVLDRFGYERLTPKSHWLRRIRGERINAYTHNRAVLWFV